MVITIEESVACGGLPHWSGKKQRESTLEYNLTNLKKWTSYSVQISALLENGTNFKQTAPLCSTTKENAPTGSPKIVSLQPRSSSSLSVTWNAPDANVTHGIVRNYTINYRRVNCSENNLVPAGNSSWNTTETETNATEWILTNLTYWSCYEVRVAAVTVAVGVFSETRTMRTLENAPTGSPKIVSLQPRSSSSLSVTWIAPDANVTHGIVRNYTINYRRVNCSENNLVPAGNSSWNTTETETNATEWILTNLTYWSCYEVRVAAVTVAVGVFSETRTMRTLENAPTGSPKIVSLQPRSSSSLFVMWKAPRSNVTHGIVRNYTINYRRVNCSENNLVPAGNSSWNTTETETNATEWILTNLTYWSCYEVRVAAVTVAVGVFSETRTMRTLENAPTGSPKIVSLQPRSSSSLSVTWIAPDANVTHGIVRNYTINYRRVNCSENNLVPAGNSSWNTTETETNATEWILTNLTYWSCYEVRVAAVTVAVGVFSETRTMRTLENAPTGSPKIVSLQPRSSSSLSVTWNAPDANVTHGIVRNYTINYRRVNCSENNLVPAGNSSWNTTETETNATEWILTNLTYWSCYEVRVAAVTVAVGVFSETRTMRTLENAPTGSPKIVSLQPRSSSSLSVTWNAPDANVTHGIVRNYTINYRRVNCSENNLVPAGNSSWNTTETETNATEWILTNLTYWSCYEVRVAAVTVAVGDFSETRTMRTLENAPTSPVTITKFTSASSTSLRLEWTPPAPDSRHGIIQKYDLFLAKGNCIRLPTQHPATTSSTTSLSTKGEGTKTEAAPTAPKRSKRSSLESDNCVFTNYSTIKTVHDFTALEKYANYSVYIKCWTVGPSDISEIKVARTNQDTPGIPQSFTCDNTSKGTIELTWEKPAEPNGIIISYELTWNPPKGFGSNSTAADVFSRSIPGLDAYTEYNFTLRAKTSIGPGVPISCIATTTDEVPGKPEGLRSTVLSAWSIQLKWKEPSVKNGIIWWYDIQVRKNGFQIKAIETERTVITIDGLEPFTEYAFHVKTRGSADYSDAAIVSNKTSPSSPPPITGTVPVVTGSSSDTKTSYPVFLREFSNQNGVIKYYMIFVFIGKAPKIDTSKFTAKNYNVHVHGKDAYVAAYLQKLPQDGIFIIGDGTTTEKKDPSKRKRRSTTSFTNSPLEPSREYSWFQRGCISDQLCRDTGWQEFTTAKSPGPAPEKSIVGAVVGAVFGVLFLFIIVVAVFFGRRRYPEKFNIVSCGKKEGDDISLDEGVVNDGFQSDGGNAPIKVELFSQYVESLRQNQGYRFSEQFTTIQNIPRGTTECSDHAINRNKNRYTNIKAYDHTRVKLHALNTPGSDYINANYIDGYKRPKAYIACQGTLTHTEDDFWRMIWEQDVQTIVMVTRCVEGGREKCSKYWPLSGSKRFDSMQVFTVERTEFPGYDISTLNVLNSREPGNEKFVRHFHFLEWPDHGVPESAPLLSFIRRVNESTPADAGPTVVHCSAGVGRTGTFIVLDTCLKKIANEGSLDPFNFLRHIRTQRNFMVQTEGQFVFINETLLEFIKCGKTEVVPNELRERIKWLKKPLPDGGIYLDKEFQLLQEFSQSSQDFTTATAAYNKTKNRFLTILPFEKTRVVLRSIPGFPGSDYINANHIDGYSKEKAFIATQAPIPNTVDDFWRMVWEQQSTTIACLIKDSETARTRMHTYWPCEAKEAQKSGPLLIEMVAEHQQGDFIVREFKVTNSQRGTSRMIRHFQYTSWPDNGTPQNGAGIVDFIGQVQKWQQQTGDKVIIVHCSTGVGRSAVFIALCNLIERLKTENVIDVFRVVCKLKKERPGMVQTKGQYLFCHIALQDYLASFDIYSNFM
eukprot:gene14549-5618_t